MKLYSKLVLLACGVAVASSALTVVAVNAISDQSALHSDVTSTYFSGQPGAGHLYRTSAAATNPPTDFTSAAESTINGVVSVKIYATPRAQQQQQYIDPFEFFFGNPFGGQRPYQQAPQEEPKEQPVGSGSGVILSEDGYIVTNNHVIENAERIEIILNDNRLFNAKVVGTDPRTDVALLKIDAHDLHVIPFGNSDALRVGEWVLAVGNPFGFNSTVTTGIVSAKARASQDGSRLSIQSYIQTDAAVNPGNSGGALVNTNGELVGINAAIISNSGQYAGISFAIPTSIVTKVVTDLKQFGTVQRAVLGVQFRPLTPQLAKEKGIKATNDGILVEEVMDRSAAMEAGIEKGDVIIAINNTPIHDQPQLQGEISRYRPGDKISIKYIRDNKEHSTSVTLRNDQGSTSMKKASTYVDLGCAFRDLTKEQLREYELTSGVQVTGITNGKIKEAGVKNGFIILSVNDVRVRSQEDIDKIYNAIIENGGSDKVMFISGIYPTGRRAYYAVDLSTYDNNNNDKK